MGVCGSRDAQSPIDISIALKDPTLQRLKFWYPVDQSTGLSEFDNDPRSALTLAYDGQALSVSNFHVMNNVQAGTPFVMLDGKERFNLASLFIRSESEHTLQGVRYPLELQLIHRHVRDVSRAVVVSLFFDVADRAAFTAQMKDVMNPAISGPAVAFKKLEELEMEPGFHPELQKLIMDAPPQMAVGGKTTQLGKHLDLGSMLMNQTFIRYPGSMTSPPCAEEVVWLVQRETPLVVSTSQLLNLGRALHKATNGNGETDRKSVV